MREISVELVKKTVEELCVKANLYLPDGMKEKINSVSAVKKVRCQSRYLAIL